MANTKITNPELFNLGDSTSATQLPVMTTTQRIAMVPTSSSPSFNIDYLVIAGGGGGGGGLGAGGGAGGLLTNVGGTSLVLATGGSGYTITVGDGGSGGQGTTPANNGDNSEFSGTGITTITSDGGGRGGHISSNGSNPILPSIGGSGGGGAWYAGSTAGGGTAAAGLTGQGNTGGNAGAGPNSNTCGGGGGGAGNLGAVGTSTNPPGNNSGAGGNGLSNSITGSGTFYAGGGAGGVWSSTGSTGGQGGGGTGGSGSTRNGGNGSANTGGGGGGAVVSFTTPNTGGTGGSGIVILRYATSDIASYTATGLTPTETTDGTDTILSFTTVGTGTINFTGALIPGTPPMTDGEMIFNSTTDKVEYWDGTKWYGITYEAPVPLAFNEMWYSVDSPYNCASNRGTITNAIADFNTYTEGQADYNTSPRTSGKWYIEILQRQSTGHNGYTVFQKSGNTTYNTAPYVSTNPVDANYGLTLYANGNICYYGDGSTLTALSPTPNLGISNNQVACIAVDVDNQKVWFGKKTSATATSVTWVSGTNPATNTGGYSVGFTEFDPMVSHASETSSRESEFGLVDVANFATPSGFSNWQGNISSSLTVNCSQH